MSQSGRPGPSLGDPHPLQLPRSRPTTDEQLGKLELELELGRQDQTRGRRRRPKEAN